MVKALGVSAYQLILRQWVACLHPNQSHVLGLHKDTASRQAIKTLNQVSRKPLLRQYLDPLPRSCGACRCAP